MDYSTYIVTEQDTMEGLALKFNMTCDPGRLYSLLRVNGLSRDSVIYPGQVLRVKSFVNEDFTPLSIPLENVPTRTNLRIFAPSEGKPLMRLLVYYCIPEGEVKGQLTVAHYGLMFYPEVSKSLMCSVYNGETTTEFPAATYHSCFDLKDLESCEYVRQETAIEPPCKDFAQSLVYLQLTLKSSFTRNPQPGRTPIVLFRLSCLSSALLPLSDEELVGKARECCEIVTKSIKEISFPPSHVSCTNLPYVEWTRIKSNSLLSRLSMSLLKFSTSFELFAEDEDDFKDFCSEMPPEHHTRTFSSATSSIIAEARAARPPAKFLINGTVTEILNEERYEALVYCLPPVLQLRPWELLFSLPTHGSSFKTFYRQSALCGPSVLLVEDSAHHVFGGFAPETWLVRKLTYGTGESFLFTFHTSNHIKSFYPTFINEYYMISDYESLAMGAG